MEINFYKNIFYRKLLELFFVNCCEKKMTCHFFRARQNPTSWVFSRKNIFYWKLLELFFVNCWRLFFVQSCWNNILLKVIGIIFCELLQNNIWLNIILLKVIEDILLLIFAKLYFIESCWNYFLFKVIEDILLLIFAKLYFIESCWNYFIVNCCKIIFDWILFCWKLLKIFYC